MKKLHNKIMCELVGVGAAFSRLSILKDENSYHNWVNYYGSALNVLEGVRHNAARYLASIEKKIADLREQHQFVTAEYLKGKYKRK